ncbi:MAG: hypothetical protein OXK73_17660 [Rhodospirillaceae bacterium]|nr:hypothetical protein [Rhodospirillaceae bacterium]
MRQQALQQPEPVGLPTAVPDGIAHAPDDAQPVPPVEPYLQPVAAAKQALALVVRRRRLQPVPGVEVADADQPAVRKPPDAGNHSVVRAVVLDIRARQVLDVVAAPEKAGEVHAHVVAEPLGDLQGIPAGADRLLDQRRGGAATPCRSPHSPG